MEKIGTPTVRGMKEAAMDYAVGAGGGLVYALSTAIFGNSLIGSVLAAALAGAIIKGEQGTVIATTLGFNGIVAALSSGSSEAAPFDAGSM